MRIEYGIVVIGKIDVNKFTYLMLVNFRLHSMQSNEHQMNHFVDADFHENFIWILR